MDIIKKIVIFLHLIVFLSFIFGEKVDESLDSCLNNTLCDNMTISEILNDNDINDIEVRELAENVFKLTKSTKNKNTTTIDNINKEANYAYNAEFFNMQNASKSRRKNEFCNCDLITNFCDVNCCCDSDCSEKHFKVFTSCIDRKLDKEKDKWYCHENPFFRRNDTRFILKKVIDSLFCIASDNVPSLYNANSHFQIDDEINLKKVLDDNEHSKFKWKLNNQKNTYQEVNFSSLYRYGDALWIVHKNFLHPFQLPQSGFGKACEFKKTIKFLEDWKSSCYQNNLNAKNFFLFPSNFINFIVVALPSKIETQYIFQNCSKDICHSINSFFCSESLTHCTNNKTIQSFCSEQFCYNIVKKVKYTIYHNGSEGIKNVEAHFHLTNISTNFKQEFEVRYKWIESNQSLIFQRSGNPGYIIGKHIFIGTQILNKTSDVEIKYIVFNKTHKYLTLPLADRSGECSQFERYPVKFLENIKLKCSIIVKSKNFSTSTCIKLHNQTMELITNFMMFKNFAKMNFDRQFVSKSGNISDNNTESWIKILVEKTVQSVITAQTIENEIQCSGLITSVMFDIVHSSIPKSTDKNHVILGVRVTFSQEVDLKWTKCIAKNCTDVLKLDLISFASFHDVSKPTRYYTTGGLNLDISLPYDFFYPFLSHSKSSGITLNYRRIFNVYIYFFMIFILQMYQFSYI